MKRIIGGLVLALVTIACETESRNDCDEYTTSIGYGYEKAEIYQSLRSGLSCKEYAAIANYEYRYPSSSCMEPQSYATSPVNDSPAEDFTSFSFNNIIDGIQEGRDIAIINNWNFYQDEWPRRIVGKNINQEISLEFNFSQVKFLSYQNKLIVIGKNRENSDWSIKIFNLVDNQLVELSSWNFVGSLTMKRVNDTLKIYEKNFNGLIPNGVECEDIYIADNSKNRSLLTSYTINLDSNELIQGNSLYGGFDVHNDVENDYFYKGSYSKDGRISLLVENDFDRITILPGKVSNKFSLKEKNNHLLFFFSNYDSHGIGSLNLVNRDISFIDGLGIRESVYGTRFTEDRAHIVTFRTIDPLYSFDISNPDEIEFLSELKVPGVSEYLHPLNDGLLLGIGRTGVWAGEAEISLFEESNKKMQKIYSLVLEGITNLSVFKNHHKVSVQGNTILLKNQYDIMVLKIIEKEIVFLGQIERLPSYYNAYLKNDKLIVLGNVYKEYYLMDGLPKVE